MKRYIVASCDGSVVVTKARFGNYPDAYGRPRCINFSLGGGSFDNSKTTPVHFKKYVRADVTREAVEKYFQSQHPGQRFNFQVKQQQ